MLVADETKRIDVITLATHLEPYRHKIYHQQTESNHQ